MDTYEGDTERVLGDLLYISHTLAMEQLPAQVAKYAARAGLHGVRIYLSDLRQEVLRLLADPDTPPEPDTETEFFIDSTLAGRTFQSGRLLRSPNRGGTRHRWWVPLLDGTERIGVLRADTDTDDERIRQRMWTLASLTALLVVSKTPHSDSQARLLRTRPMTVTAEMQWNLTPPRVFVTDQVTASAFLEPAYEISGDAVDYAVDGHILHLAVFDAMGHDTAAGLTANLAVAACRNHRRQGTELTELGESVERALLTQFGYGRYATAILAELDTRTGVLSWTNHGHHLPILVRGGRWTTTLACRPSHPLGTDLGLWPTLCREQLQPGDRVVCYTDGIIEARDPRGREFGLERFTEFLLRHHSTGLPVPETLRRLVHSVVDYHHGRLDDDATVLLVQWHGSAGRAPRQAGGLRARPPR